MYNNHVTLPVTNIHWKLPAGDHICICFANNKALDNEDIGWKNYHKYKKKFPLSHIMGDHVQLLLIHVLLYKSY